MTKTLSIAALIAGMATASFAGNPVVGADDSDVGVLPVAPSSAGLALPLAIGAAAIGIALIASDSNGSSSSTTTDSEDD